MKKALLFLLPLTIACSQPEPAVSAVVDGATANEPSQADKDNWSKHKGRYSLVATQEEPHDYLTSSCCLMLNEDGTFSWAGTNRNGTYYINSSTNEMKMYIKSNAGIVQEHVYYLDEKGEWRYPRKKIRVGSNIRLTKID
jgi:hypothetical protein